MFDDLSGFQIAYLYVMTLFIIIILVLGYKDEKREDSPTLSSEDSFEDSEASPDDPE